MSTTPTATSHSLSMEEFDRQIRNASYPPRGSRPSPTIPRTPIPTPPPVASSSTGKQPETHAGYRFTRTTSDLEEVEYWVPAARTLGSNGKDEC